MERFVILLALAGLSYLLLYTEGLVKTSRARFAMLGVLLAAFGVRFILFGIEPTWRTRSSGTGTPEGSGASAPPLFPIRSRCSTFWRSFLLRRAAGLPYLNISAFLPR